MKPGPSVGGRLAAEFFGFCRPQGGLLQVIAILFFATTAHADYQAGLDAYNAGDYAMAMAEWKAEVGQPGEPANLAVYRETLYAIGMLYWRGEGVAQDYAVSAVWLKQAADINHPGAQVKLGYLYVAGLGVPQNHVQARRWFELAAWQGDRDAAHNLDVMDEQGLGLPAEGDDADFGALSGQGNASPPPAAELPAEQAGIPPASPAVAGAEPPASPVPEPGRDAGPAWILAQDPQHYTIQVVALRARDKLEAFIGRNPDWSPFAIYRPKDNERPLWVLVQGAYADVGAARAAVQAFPPGLQKRDQLWIRRFGMVQGMIE